VSAAGIKCRILQCHLSHIGFLCNFDARTVRTESVMLKLPNLSFFPFTTGTSENLVLKSVPVKLSQLAEANDLRINVCPLTLTSVGPMSEIMPSW
jgi:hypothetical protein